MGMSTDAELIKKSAPFTKLGHEGDATVVTVDVYGETFSCAIEEHKDSKHEKLWCRVKHTENSDWRWRGR